MSDRQQLERAVEVLRSGGVIGYPTEGCFGLGCDPRNTAAIRSLLGRKRRSWRQGLILIGAHWGQLAPWVDRSDPLPLARARATWPGPHTWLLPAHPQVSRWLRGEHDTIAVRITAHALAAALCRAFRGAIVSTSANRHGFPPVATAGQLERQFAGGVELVLAGRLGGSPGPTAIHDARTGKMLRAG
ncbi:MAG: Sua5/YciO/YrdC/YwlC family protein [Gammaproteobacteria bacterium]|nr:Sua5/YciO/YrdC/YwlC family protein [Gammaproteobacteria bacterium]